MDIPLKTTTTAERAREAELEELLRSCLREYFQTEESAERHCRVEAQRLLGTPIAPDLMAIADHAAQVLKDLAPMAKARDLPVSGLGMTVGRFFSDARRTVFDKLIDLERSYRGTLLGVRHGVDLVTFIRAVAREQHDTELEAYTAQWLLKRSPLLGALEGHLDWLAGNPALALRR